MDPEKTMAFILDAQAKAEVEMAAIREMQAKAGTDIAAINHTLRRAIRLGVREARNQRKRNQVLDEKITQLSAAQVVTEEKLQKLIDALRRGGNGSG